MVRNLAIVLAAAGLFLFGFVVGLMLPQGQAINSKSSLASELIFKRMLAVDSTIDDRRQAAYQLPATEEASVWIVWILTAEDPFLWNEIADETKSALDNSVIAALLEALPENLSKAELLAVTTLLDDLEYGRYSEMQGSGLVTRRVEKRTRPINEIAHDVLVDRLETDCGYDKQLWRNAIIESEIPDADVSKNLD